MYPHAFGDTPPPQRWRLLAVATLQQAGLTLVRFGLPALAPFVRADMGLSLPQTGAVLGAFDLGALLAFYVTGVATERWGERHVMAVGALLTGLLAAAASMAPSLVVLTLVLAAAGTGFASSQVAGSHAVLSWFGFRERGLAMGVRQAGLPIGGLAGAWLLPWLATRYGWRLALLVAAAWCAAAGLATWIGLADLRRVGPEPQPPAGAAPSFVEAPWRFVRDPTLVLTTLTACLLAAGQFSLTGYLPLYMVDVFGWAPAGAARLLLLVHAGGIAGRLLWGWISDRLLGADRVRPLALAAWAASMSAAMVASLAGLSPLSTLVAGGAALLSGFTMLGWNGLYVTLLSERAGSSAAVMLGLSMTVLYVWTMLSPPAFGWLVQHVGGHHSLAWWAVSALQMVAVATAAGIGRVLAGTRAGRRLPAEVR
ncbi:MFS transporter [Geochorda subterranea]|uniref:MFS transporter n=1 Tax=Geochorda subterranea TaxID=3109564 RepID=A0ABZ1BN57_9FIRM|nr:MFS transporter [Limnochorda sp. LNt]WRP14260.1 MFS transporter [Limnochorda sp. LNt]